MFGSYGESAKLIEELMESYAALPLPEGELAAAMNALQAARAMILKEENDDAERVIHEMSGKDCPNYSAILESLTYEELTGGI